MKQIAIFYPCLAMVAITAVVWLKLLWDRITEMQQRRIRPEDVSTSRQVAQILKNLQSAENFSNIFELPTLFYPLCISLFLTESVNITFILLAWLFVALRATHSWIHCTYNEVMHRFYAYILSSLILFAAWGIFAFHLIIGPANKLL